MKKINDTLKNVVVEDEVKKDVFNTFLSHFKGLKKNNGQFYSYDNRNVDYSLIQGEAKKAGIKQIPTEQELSQLV